MKLAVVQHRLRSDALEDARELASAAARAAEGGAELVILPPVDTLADPAAWDAFGAATRELPAGIIIARVTPSVRAHVFTASEVPTVSDRLGPAALLYGDACMDPAVLERTAAEQPAVLILNPRAEGELQAEAMLELAISLSESVAGLVVIAETLGGDFGEVGHGGSAVVLLGDVMAEAFEDEVLLVDVPEPVPAPGPRDAVPPMPTILQQRLANHEGRHLDPGYLAELG